MEFAEHRFTVSEVASLTETNLGTVQAWRRRGFFGLEQSEGWHRYTLEELFSIAVFAEVNAACRDQQFASCVAYLACAFLGELLQAKEQNDFRPYLVGGPGGNEPILEVTYGARDVGRVLAELIEGGADAGAFVVVDYSAIFARLFRRLEAGGYADQAGGV